jgi:hypothetical protein
MSNRQMIGCGDARNSCPADHNVSGVSVWILYHEVSF